MLYSKKDFKIFLEKRNYMPKNGMPDYVRYILNSRSPKTRFNSEKAEYTPVGYGGLYTMNEPWGDDLHNEVPDYGWDVLPKDSWERTKASNWDRALNWAQDLADKARSNATELRPNRAAQYLSAYPNTPYVGLTVRESPNKRTSGKTDVYGVKANWMNMPITGGIANSSMTKRASMCKCGSGMSKSMCKCGSGMSKSYGLSKAKEKICDCGRPVSKCTCSGHEHGRKTSKRMSKSMDMKTRAPKMPSTRRDIRNTDKYFR